MSRVLFILLLIGIPKLLLSQDSLSYVIIAHSFDNREKAVAIAQNYTERNIKCEVVEANHSGIFRICLNRYPDYTSADISRKALIKSKAIPADAWILTETVSKQLSPKKVNQEHSEIKKIASSKRYIIYKGKVYKLPFIQVK